MKPTYNLKWLTDKFDAGEQLKYIFFWGHNSKTPQEPGKHCFSQWFELPFKVDSITYPTAEHWMMAHKALLFEDIKTHDKIIAAKSPAEAKKLGREIAGFDEVIWMENRFDIVVNGNIHKFNQHPQFAEYLLNTGNRVIVEASPPDKIWGIGMGQDDEGIENPYAWRGLNMLGFALMEARSFLNKYGHFETPETDNMLVPWKAFPGIDPCDMFWRMGAGESFVMAFAEYYDGLPEEVQVIFRVNYPPPYVWQGFYGE